MAKPPNTIPAHREAIHQLGGFGVVIWTEDDIKVALARRGLPYTQANIDAVRDSRATVTMSERMVELGWDCLDLAIDQAFPAEESVA